MFSAQNVYAQQDRLKPAEPKFNYSTIGYGSHFGAPEMLAGECDGAIPIQSGNITNQPLLCGENLLNSTSVTNMCTVDYVSGLDISPNYGNGNEALYSYLPSTSGTMSITVSNTTFTAIFLYEGCPTEGGVCVAGVRSGTPSRSLEIAVEADTQYYLWIDTWPDPASPCVEGGIMNFTGPEPANTEDCFAVFPPYTEDFETAVVPDLPECTSVETVGSGNAWVTTNTTSGDFNGNYLMYSANQNPADAWFYTRAIQLLEGTTYRIAFDYGSGGSSTFPENLGVFYGTENQATEMVNELGVFEEFSSDMTAVQGEINFVAETTGVYYFGFHAYSDADMSSIYLDNIQIEEVVEPGCLYAPGGEFPLNTVFTPGCYGSPETIVFNGWPGEYSTLLLFAGTEYIFSTSVETDFITIARDETLEVMAYGTGAVTFTPTETYTYRFYNHTDENCGLESVDRMRLVQCGEPRPLPEACTDYVVESNFLQDGLFFGGANNQRLAIDIPTGDTAFTANGINMHTIGAAGYFNFKFYLADEQGLPGEMIAERTGNIESSVVTGTNFSLNFYQHEVLFDTPFNFEPNTVYWIEAESDALAWELNTLPGGVGVVDAFLNANTEMVWATTETDNFVFSLICESLSTNDVATREFSFYPNPVKDILHFSMNGEIKNAHVFNVSGQLVKTFATVNSKQINLAGLPAGVYMIQLETSQGKEAVKVIKK